MNTSSRLVNRRLYSGAWNLSNILEDKRVNVVSLAQRRERLLNAKSSQLPALPGPGDINEANGTYGVSTENGDCIISLGPIPPFRIPKDVAIKLAMLILRRCGVEVENGQE